MAPTADLGSHVAAVTQVLRRRRALLRGLGLLLALDLAASLFAAAFALRTAMAACLLGVVLFVLYLAMDAGFVGRWRRGVLRPWVSGALNLGVLAGALRTLDAMPQATLLAMARTLPVLTPLRDRDLGAKERAGLAAFSHWCWVDATTVALGPGAALATACAGTAALLLGLPSSGVTIGLGCAAPAAVLGVVRWVPSGLARHRLQRILASAQPATIAAIQASATDLDWSGTSEARRHRLLQALGSPAAPPGRSLIVISRLGKTHNLCASHREQVQNHSYCRGGCEPI